MAKATERALHALTRLRAPDFKSYVEYLTNKRSEYIETLVKATDPEYKARLSGKAELLCDMLDEIEQSEEILKKVVRTSGP